MHVPDLATELVLRLYPRRWRERYEGEMRALLAEREPGLGDLLDLALGGIDARLHRLFPAPTQLVAALPPREIVMTAPTRPTYGAVDRQPIGELSRRSFMRRMLGLGAAILGLEFAAGTISFLWPQFRSGLGAKYAIGTVADIVAKQPSFANGWPFAIGAARTFLINVPAAKELALGHAASVPNPAAGELLALWRKCPHLGCQVPALCDSLKRFTCLCHGSTYNILGEKLKEGPASRGMDRFAITVGEDGIVVIDTGVVTAGELNRGPDHLTFVDAAPYDQRCK